MFFVTTILVVLTTAIFIAISFFYFTIRQLFFRDDRYIRTSRNRAILITGCDSGIGLELAKHFYSHHNFTIICCFLDTNSSGYQELNELQDKEKIKLFKLDVTSDLDLIQMNVKIEEWKSEKLFTHLWALINNAGVMVYGEFDWLTRKQIEHQINVNVMGTIKLSHTLLPHIIESKGRIVNVSSVNDTIIFPGISVYTATKSAISAFSMALGYELRKFGCRVINVRPGDYARLTNILANHRDNQESMWNNMSEKKRIIYKDYFPAFNKHLMENYGMTSPPSMDESSIFNDFEKALISAEPPEIITSSQMHFRIIYSIIQVLPVWIQYIILDIIVQVGFRWSSSGVRVHTND